VPAGSAWATFKLIRVLRLVLATVKGPTARLPAPDF
jgi:hypothetical protein